MSSKVAGYAKWPDGLVRNQFFLLRCKRIINSLYKDYIAMKDINGFWGQQYTPFMPKGAFKNSNLKWN